MKLLDPQDKSWRGRTVSHIFQFPGVTLGLIIGLAILITIVLTGHVAQAPPTIP
ncbi:MAG TPA: hypothetical protein V6C81_19660 [Planktothrix sp.]|jgi:hypothetical protein